MHFKPSGFRVKGFRGLGSGLSPNPAEFKLCKER